MKQLLPRRNYYKANLHMHTTVSDGELTPEQVKKLYMENGYSIVAYTDHEVMLPHEELTDENFLALTSYEIALSRPAEGDGFSFMKAVHLNLYAPAADPGPAPVLNPNGAWWPSNLRYVTDEMRKNEYDADYDHVNDLIARANEAGYLVSYNHPVWSLQDHTDYCGYRGVWGVEIWNTGTARDAYRDTPQPWEDLLRLGNRPFPLATDDAHGREQCCGGWVWVAADRLDYESVFASLKRGDFYASTGPEILSIESDGGFITVKCSAAKMIAVSTERRFTRRLRADEGEVLTEARFDMREYLSHDDLGRGWIRVTVTDDRGDNAWSRAYGTGEWA